MQGASAYAVLRDRLIKLTEVELRAFVAGYLCARSGDTWLAQALRELKLDRLAARVETALCGSVEMRDIMMNWDTGVNSK